MNEIIEGGCLCGAVRYRVDEQAPPVYACFCTDCQSRSGTSHALIMPVWRTRFATEGELLCGRRRLATGAEATVCSCAKCMTELYSYNEKLPDLYTVRAGTLDGKEHIAPAAYMWTGSKQTWIEIPAGALTFETQPDDPTQWMEILQFGRRPQ